MSANLVSDVRVRFRLRLGRVVSQDEFGAYLAIPGKHPGRTIRRWEKTGVDGPAVIALLALAQALDPAAPEWVYGRDDSDRPTIMRMRWPRFVGLITNSAHESLPSAGIAAGRHVVAFVWLDEPGLGVTAEAVVESAAAWLRDRFDWTPPPTKESSKQGGFFEPAEASADPPPQEQAASKSGDEQPTQLA